MDKNSSPLGLFNDTNVDIIDQAFDSSYRILQRLNVTLYDNQIYLIEAISDPKKEFIITAQARGAGKTYGVACGLINLCEDLPGYKILIFAPKSDQATRVVNEMYDVINKSNMRDQVDFKKSNKSTLRFKNGSNVIAQSASEQTEGEGYHANCTLETTIIRTNKGYKTIGEIVNNKIECEVMSYNEITKRIEYKPITHWHKNEINNRKMIKITYLDYGKEKEITCTEDHKIFTSNKGWVKAIDITENDDIITGRKVSISNGLKDGYKTGKIKNWTEGLTKQTSTKINNASIKSANTQKEGYKTGRLKSYRKGKTKYNCDSIAKGSLKILGHKVSEETRTRWKKLAIKNSKDKELVKKRNKAIKLAHSNPIVKEKQALTLAKHIADGTVKPKFMDTIPELKRLEQQVKNGFIIGKTIIKQKYVKHVGIVDFYYPETNTIEFIDGDYWHCNPKKFKPCSYISQTNQFAKQIWDRDDKITKIAVKLGYNVHRIWESDIKKGDFCGKSY